MGVGCCYFASTLNYVVIMENEFNPQLLASDLDLAKQTSSFKLMKMSKGYNWEIKIYTEDIFEMQQKIKLLDNWAKMEFSELNVEGKSEESKHPHL